MHHSHGLGEFSCQLLRAHYSRLSSRALLKPSRCSPSVASAILAVVVLLRPARAFGNEMECHIDPAKWKDLSVAASRPIHSEMQMPAH